MISMTCYDCLELIVFELLLHVLNTQTVCLTFEYPILVYVHDYVSNSVVYM